MKRLIIFSLTLLAMLNCYAQNDKLTISDSASKEQEENTSTIDFSNDGKFAIGVKLGMSLSPSIDAEINLEYRPFRYLGANVGFMFITPFNYSGNIVKNIPIIEDEYKELKNSNDCLYRTAVKAGLQFTTPAVMLTKGEMGLSLRLSPGIIMPFPTDKRVKVLIGEVIEVPDDVEPEIEQDNVFIYSEEYQDNNGAKFCYWYGRAELVLEYEENWEFTIGYTYSNFDLYGGARNIKVHDTPIVIGKKENFQSISLGLTYKF